MRVAMMTMRITMMTMRITMIQRKRDRSRERKRAGIGLLVGREKHTGQVRFHEPYYTSATQSPQTAT
jgi:hypothetical protein